jgi:hypothetical protein
MVFHEMSVGALINWEGTTYGVAIASSLRLTVAAFADILVQIAVPGHVLFTDGTMTERANGSGHESSPGAQSAATG